MTRASRIPAVAVLVWGVAAGCGKRGGGADDAVLDQLPKDSFAVMRISLDHARESPHYPQLVAALGAEVPPILDEIRAACGIDLPADLRSITFAARTPDELGMFTAVRARPSRQEVDACIDAMAGRGQPVAHAAVPTAAALTTYTLHDEAFTARWPDDHLMIAGYGPEAFAATEPGLRGNAALMTLVERVDDRAALWLAATVSDTVMWPAPPRPQGLYISVTLASGLQAVGGILYRTEEDARQAATALGGLLDGAKGHRLAMVAQAMRIEAVGREAKVTLTLDSAQVSMLTTALRMHQAR
jgi:hypothetical protein